ncbi:MAG: MATE family efflux transporter [Clostridiales bacterium]|nr:MATE family efflux transporter [Clostridiales bacterium]
MNRSKYLLSKTDVSNTMFSKEEIRRLIVPLIIEQILSCLVGLADSAMVSSVGEAAVAAVSLVDSISILMVNIFAALAAGGAIVVGQYIGSKDLYCARRVSRQLIVVVLVISLLITGVLLLLQEEILGLLFGKAEAAVRGNCQIYYRIVMKSVPFIALYNGGAALFRAVGNSKVPMRISMLMNLVNVAGNAFLIYGLKLGVAGVAIPTLVSRGIAMTAILALVFKHSFPLSLQGLGHYRTDKQQIGQILSMGVPNGMENAMFQMGKIFLLSLVSTLPTAAVTANAIGNTTSVLHCVVGSAANLAIASVVSRCVGAGDYLQARWYIQHFVRFTYKVQSITCGLMVAAIPLILNIYHVSSETARLSALIMLIHGLGTIFLWPLSFCVNTGMRAAGDVRFTSIISSLSMWLFRVGLSYVFVLPCHMGVLGVWIAWLVDWVFRIAVFLPRYFSHKWETKAVI